MTQHSSGNYGPPSLMYQAVDQRAAADESHLRLLTIFHYIWGPMVMLFSSIFIIHIVLGAIMLKSPALIMRPIPPGSSSSPAPPMPPASLGWVFIGMGSFAVICGWAVGILNIVSGRAIARRKWRIFSLVISGINCLSVPFGTAVGVFTFIVLLRESVRERYAGSVASKPESLYVAPYQS